MDSIIQKYINLYLDKITTQNAISVAIKIASCFGVELRKVCNLLADAIAKISDIYA